MTSVTRERYIREYGVEAGAVMYDRELGQGKQAAATAELKEQQRAVEAEKTSREAELAKLLIPLQAAHDAAHDKWLSACKALEAQRIENQAAMSDVNNRIATLRQSLNTPLIYGRYTWEKVKVDRPDAM